jgi:hypothetical protein
MANRYWVGGTGTWDASSTANWSATSGGASGASAPTAADAVFFDSGSGSGTVTTASGSACAACTFNSTGVTLVFGANHTASGTFTLTQGAIDLGANKLTCTIFNTSNSNTRSIAFGTGSIDLTGNSAVIWTTGTVTNFSYTGTPNINATYSGSTGTRTFSISASTTAAQALNFNITAGSDIINVGSAVYKNLNYTGFTGSGGLGSFCNGDLTLGAGMTTPASTGTLTFSATSGTQNVTTNGVTIDRPLAVDATGSIVAFQDALTLGSTRTFRITNGTVELKNGATSTVGAFTTSGTNQKFLKSTVAGSQATLSDASGTNSVSYLTIQDINATGGATWDAFYSNGNNDAGNNTGWNFGGTPAVSTEVTYSLRSFTTPRRF